MFVIALASLIAVAFAGVVQHGNGEGHGQATSYQHVKIENLHPVPVYVKKDHQQFLEHPVSKGHSTTSLEVHHGGHHDHDHDDHEQGYALVDITHQAAGGQEAYGSLSDGEGLSGHYEQAPEHAVQAAQGYQGQGGDVGGYEHDSVGYEQIGAGGYGPESADYGQDTVAYTQDNAGYGHDEAALAYEQAAAAAHGHHGHDHQ